MNSKIKMLWLFLKRYKTRSIFMRDFVIVFLIVLIPLMTMGMYLYNRIKVMVSNEIISVNEANLKSCAGIIDSLLEEIDIAVANMSLNNDVKLWVISDSETAKTLGFEAKVNEYMTDMLVTRDYVDSIYIFNDEYDVVYYQNICTPLENFNDKGWYDRYSNIDSYYTQSVNLRLKNDFYPQLITFVRPIYKSYMSAKAGAVICNIDIKKLCKIANVSEDIFNQFIITDSSNNVVYSKSRNLIGTNIVTEPFKKSVNISTGIENSGENVYISETKPEKFGDWKYMLKFSTSEFEQKSSEVLYILRTVLLFCFIISLIAALFMTFKSFGFVSKFVDVIQRYTGSGSKESFNETDYIISNIVSAMSMNEQLQNELLEQIGTLREVQTSALQSQISPHFMRNTLSVISFKAFEVLDGKNDISDMLNIFSNLMDCYVKSGDYIVPLRNELENAELYVKLMNLRFDDKVKMSYNIPDELLDCSVIKITLQPIIENSISHGFKSKRSQGNIHISAEAENEFFCIYVDDDGCGMSDDEIDRLNSVLADIDSSSRVGINNVNKRYKIALGDEYGITISNSKLGGLCVKIKIPFII